jgi:hypothetical protein
MAPPTTSDAATSAPKSFTRFMPAVGRILLGLPFFVGGANAFLKLLPEPKAEMSDAATAFVGALVASGYMLPLIMGTQLIVGTLLLANRFVPLALALIAPFLVNALAFHIVLERSGLPFVLVFVALELALAWAYRGAFRPMLAMRARPGG